jgi:sugar lactone lactonase YvrE
MSLGPTPYLACIVELYKDGPAETARFGHFSGLALDSRGNILVSDQNRIRKISAEGVVSTIAELPLGRGAGDITVDRSGTIFFINGDYVYQVTAGGATTSVAGTESFPKLLWGPRGLTMNASGDMLVADTRNHRIKRVTANGDVSEVAGSGYTDIDHLFIGRGPGGGFADGPASSALFRHPSGIAIDPDGDMYVSDSNNHRIRKITTDGMVTTFAGSGTKGEQDGKADEAQFSHLGDIAVTSDGTVYVIDSNRIRKISPDGMVSTLPPVGAEKAVPRALAVNASDSVYVAVVLAEGDLRGGQVLKQTSGDNFAVVAGELAACSWEERMAW